VAVSSIAGATDSTVIGWSDAVAKGGSGLTQAAPWTLPLLVLGLLAVIISAGVVIARVHADEVAADGEPPASQISREVDDPHLGALGTEHRRVLRGY
jgi:hypothetical protein